MTNTPITTTRPASIKPIDRLIVANADSEKGTGGKAESSKKEIAENRKFKAVSGCISGNQAKGALSKARPRPASISMAMVRTMTAKLLHQRRKRI